LPRPFGLRTSRWTGAKSAIPASAHRIRRYVSGSVAPSAFFRPMRVVGLRTERWHFRHATRSCPKSTRTVPVRGCCGDRVDTAPKSAISTPASRVRKRFQPVTLKRPRMGLLYGSQPAWAFTRLPRGPLPAGLIRCRPMIAPQSEQASGNPQQV